MSQNIFLTKKHIPTLWLCFFVGTFSALNIVCKEIKFSNPITGALIYTHHIPTKYNIVIFFLCAACLISYAYIIKLPLRSISEACVQSLLCICVTLTFSNITNGPFTFFENTHPSIIYVYAIGFCFFLNKSKSILISAIQASLCIIPLAFLTYSKGKSVFTDDHAAVAYRLHLLSEYFPHIPVYNPLWNLGTDWRDFFATGILNVFTLFYPLLLLTNSISAHAIIVPVLLFVLFPLSCYYATRLHYTSVTGSLLSASIGVCCSTLFYKWALSYGSLGFVCSLTLIPITSSLMLKIIDDCSSGKTLFFSHVIAWLITLTLSITWSMQAVALLPLIIATGIYATPHIIRKKTFLCFFLCVLCINLLWMCVFVKVSKVGSFLKAETSAHAEPSQGNNNFSKKSVKGNAGVFDIKKTQLLIKENLTKANPLLYLFCIPAIFSFANIRLRFFLGLTVTWLLLIGTIGSSYKPQLELDRFLLIATVISVFPVAKYIDQFVILPKTRIHSIMQILLSVMIASSLISTSAIVQNRGSHKFSLLPEELKTLAQKISLHGGEGRTVFSGFILHDMGGSHLAPLAQLTQKPLVGSSPVHNLWLHTDVIPEDYRKKGPEGVEEYLSLVNSTLVIAHEKVWKEYFSQNPAIYSHVDTVGKFYLFKRAHTPSYFLNGIGEVIKQEGDRVILKLKSEDATILFNYFPFLTVEKCNTIEPYLNKTSFTFIKLSGCSLNQEIEIRSSSPIKRLLF